MNSTQWTSFVIGYMLTVAVELPILWIGLARNYSRPDRLWAGFWLTACTFPIVWLVLPNLCVGPRWQYLIAAESFAPLAECLLFRAAFSARPCFSASPNREDAVILLANVASFAMGELGVTSI